MKRINRKKLISELEELRQGFRSWRDIGCLHGKISKQSARVAKITADAYHSMIDKLIMELGGESVRTKKNGYPKEFK
jgi:hypothetical protein